MTLLTCAAVRRRLQAFYDRELAVGELISIEGHLNDCPPCARDLRELRDVGEALRLAAARAVLGEPFLQALLAQAQELMEAATDAVMDRAHENATSHRAAAYEIAIQRVADAGRMRGWH